MPEDNVLADLKTPDQKDVPAPAVDESILSNLVGDDKKFKSAEDLAKGKLESDRFIEQLKEENADLRGNLDRRLAAEDILKEIKKATGNEQDKETPSDDSGQPAPKSYELEDIVSLVDQRVTAKQEQERADRNRETANAKLVAKLGDPSKAAAFLKQKSEELGVSGQWLVEVAEKSPEAFLNALGIEVPKVRVPDPVYEEGNVNTGALDHTGGDTDNQKPYFDDMRRKDRDRWMSPEVQKKIMALGFEGKYY